MKPALLPLLPSRMSRVAAATSLLLSPFHLQAADVPAIMKAKSIPPKLLTATSQQQESLDAFFVSEKLDGIRAIWTGRKFITRSGKPISAPAWFTASLPADIRLDGELWAGRNSFQQVAATVRDHLPNEEQWQKIKYMIFDLPSHGGRFERRLKQLETIVSDINHPHIRLVPQYTVDTPEALENKLDQVTESSGEGLMLHHKDNLYEQGRSDRLIKMKQYQDAEAIVIGYEEGNGKYQGKMGAIWVLTPDNKKFKLGSGFSDAERATPPAMGAVIQYRHNGYTKSGIPRFARFIRVRTSPDL